jgi:hypothetical protein
LRFSQNYGEFGTHSDCCLAPSDRWDKVDNECDIKL